MVAEEEGDGHLEVDELVAGEARVGAEFLFGDDLVSGLGVVTDDL